MNKKGATGQTFLLFAVFIGIIFALALVPEIFSRQSTVTTIQTVANGTFTVPALNTLTDLAVCQQANTSAITIWNATGNVKYPSANYSVTQGISSTNGYPSAQITFTGTFNGTNVAGTTATVDCNYQAFGYNTDSGARSIGGLWGLFTVLALVAFVLIGVKFEWFEF